MSLSNSGEVSLWDHLLFDLLFKFLSVVVRIELAKIGSVTVLDAWLDEDDLLVRFSLKFSPLLHKGERARA